MFSTKLLTNLIPYSKFELVAHVLHVPSSSDLLLCEGASVINGVCANVLLLESALVALKHLPFYFKLAVFILAMTINEALGYLEMTEFHQELLCVLHVMASPFLFHFLQIDLIKFVNVQRL